MNTKHILVMSALAVSALAFTSCEDFFETSSKKDLNTETAYSNLESAEGFGGLLRWMATYHFRCRHGHVPVGGICIRAGFGRSWFLR